MWNPGKSNTKTGCQDDLGNKLPEWARKVRELRGTRSQTAFAKTVGVSQVAVSRWENGADKPSEFAFRTLSQIADEPLRSYFKQFSDFPDERVDFYPGRPSGFGIRIFPTRTRRAASNIQLYHREVLIVDPYLLGTLESRNREWPALALPLDWCGIREDLWAVKISGNNMYPPIREGDTVVVDCDQTDPEKLIDRRVAVRCPDGVTVKWLRIYDQGLVVTSESNSEYRKPQEQGDDSLLGEVLFWIGQSQSFV